MIFLYSIFCISLLRKRRVNSSRRTRDASLINAIVKIVFLLDSSISSFVCSSFPVRSMVTQAKRTRTLWALRATRNLIVRCEREKTDHRGGGRVSHGRGASTQVAGRSKREVKIKRSSSWIRGYADAVHRFYV
jgi:steroid 5-alpha reductase family enzyme